MLVQPLRHEYGTVVVRLDRARGEALEPEPASEAGEGLLILLARLGSAVAMDALRGRCHFDLLGGAPRFTKPEPAETDTASDLPWEVFVPKWRS